MMRLACPVCRGPLQSEGADYRCCRESILFRQYDGFVDCLPPGLEAPFRQFLTDYRTIRSQEGWGSDQSSYYRALPYCRRNVPGYPWKIRARSYECLARILKIRGLGREDLILDAGCGNGWLSFRLLQSGFRTAAVDISDDPRDGLRAFHHYAEGVSGAEGIRRFRCDFDHLPFDGGQFAAVIFNASFHYARDYEKTIAEALRVLRPGALLAVVDTPTYTDAESGLTMVRERKARFQETYGFASDTLGSGEFITPETLNKVGTPFGLSWVSQSPNHGWAWKARSVKAALLERRPPARFPIWMADKPE